MAARVSRPAARPTAKSSSALSWNEIRPAPVVLVSGTENFLADRAIRRLRDILSTEDPSLEVTDLDAADYARGELISMASPSLFGEPRMVRVSNVERCNDDFMAEAISYLGSPAADAYIVLRHGGGVRGKRLLDALRAGTGGAIEVACAELKKDSDKYDFAVAEFRTAGRRITPGALRAVLSAFSDDVAELATACAQLISDSSEEITESVVDKYYGGRVETNAFKVADAAIAGRNGEALALLRHALASGSDPVPLVAAFAAKLRTMAKVMGARGASGQLASQLGIAPWQVDRARRDLEGWSENGLAACIELLADTDERIKGAGRDPVYAVERMVLGIASRGASL
ncbi:DNA polymerase III subunit delta [Naasia lichenicola]|uniref:DNA-directed DNA polymerase n=1 Tax=Naasia lichenicola TaxID=2565933 RepID=A0A4S4FI56_9MICO|nr:DNA polymerase III subunit delta [Naasia lichenicola]THG28756.1 DNA polymerase III subunit delta [Naasia lichenicola]